ncbi:hypothetical protein [Streptomyces canus]
MHVLARSRNLLANAADSVHQATTGCTSPTPGQRWAATAPNSSATDRGLRRLQPGRGRPGPGRLADPAVGRHCTYAADWIIVKTRWQLTIDQVEKTARVGILDDCPNRTVEVTLARDQAYGRTAACNASHAARAAAFQ